MSLSFLFDPNKQFQSIGGVNEVSGFLRVFLNGTDDRATTYKNFDGTLNEADIVLDTYGRAVVIVDDTKTYRMEVYNRLGGLMWTVSNYKARGGSGGSGTPVSVEGTVGEIDVDENSAGGVKHFVVGLATTIKNAIATLTMAVNGLANALNGKKDKQTPVNGTGATTKTLVGITQDANGEISPEFDDIAFPDWTSAINAAVATCEKLENKKTTVTGFESSNTYYPTIKAVVDFVNGMLQNLGGKLITDNGDAFTDSSDLPSTTPYGGVDIADKDYAYIQNTGTAERWSATVSGSSVTWQQEYAISIPVFTPSQQAAIDSGVTAEMLGTFLPKTGDGSNVTATFTAAVSRTNISTGEKLSVIFGKIAKWFADLKALAFKDNVSDSDISGTIADAHIASASTWNNKQNALPTSGTPSSTFAINVSGTAKSVAVDTIGTSASTWLELGTFKFNQNVAMFAGLTLSVEFRSNDARSESGFLWVSAGEWKASGDYTNDDIIIEYYTLGRRDQNKTTNVAFYAKSLGTSSTSGVKLYAKLEGNSTIFVAPVNAIQGSYTPLMIYLDSEPTGTKEAKYSHLLRTENGTAVGSQMVPVFVNSYGQVQECTPANMSVGSSVIANYLKRAYVNKSNQTTKIWKKIATSKTFTTWDACSICFLYNHSGYISELGLDSIVSVSIRTGNAGSFANARIDTYSYRSASETQLVRIGSTNQYEVWVKVPTTDTNMYATVLNSYGGWTINTDESQTGQLTDDEFTAYKSSNPSVGTDYNYNIAKASKGGVGSSTVPVYVDPNGTLIPCSLPSSVQTWVGEVYSSATCEYYGGVYRFRGNLALNHGWGDGAHGYINYQMIVTRSARKNKNCPCGFRLTPHYSGGTGISFKQIYSQFVDSPSVFIAENQLHESGIGPCGTGSGRTIPTSLDYDIVVESSDWSVGETVNISLYVTAVKQ